MKARFALSALLLVGASASAQPVSPDVAEQKSAITALDFLDGEWVGSAKGHTEAGSIDLIQTERIGSLLDGTVKLIEGRGYDATGATVFNALAVISYDPKADKYRMRSYAQGHVTDADFTRTDDGFEWGFPAGPGRMQFKASVRDGRWTEIGTFTMPGRPVVTTTQLDLKKKGQSAWPRDRAVDPSP